MNDSQDYDQFLVEFKESIRPEFSGADYLKICQRHSSFLMFSGGNVPGGNFPLEALKTEPIYLQNIVSLLHSANANHRILAYSTAAAAGDSSHNDLLLKAMKVDPNNECRIYAFGALLRLRDSHTEILFDYLVENNEVAPLMAMYIYLNKSSLQRVAYIKVKSKNDAAKILAVQSLAVTDLNQKTEAVLREAISDWTLAIKSHAIDTAKYLKMGNLKELLLPYVQNENLRGHCLAALACSPTLADEQYLSTLIPTEGEIPDDILNAYLKSTNEAAVRTWLILVRDREVSAEYYFCAYNQQLLLADRFLDSVRDTIERTKNSGVRRELSRAVAARADNER